MTDLTREELEDMLVRAEKATPGPWCGAGIEPQAMSRVQATMYATQGTTNLIAWVPSGRAGKEQAVDDAKFIAHAREDLPRVVRALLAKMEDDYE